MNPRRSRLGSLALAGVLAACGGCGAQAAANDGGTDAPPGDRASAHGYLLPGFPGGYDFAVLLPPSFAPLLSLSGEEATREPPEADFYAPASPYYFSYAFIWWLVGNPVLTTATLQSDLDLYYTGLCPSQTVTVTLQEPAAGATADAGAGMLVARRAGTLDVGTCFDNPVPPSVVELSTYDCPDHHAVIALISPQETSGQVWQELRGIRDGFSCW